MQKRDISNVRELIRYLSERGFTVTENALVDRVEAVHSRGSMHYQKGAKGNFPKDRQGNLGFDVNCLPQRLQRGQVWLKVDGKKKVFKSEYEALKALYKDLKEAAQRFRWPLNEMFFNAWGFRQETGYKVNTPIGNHDTHLHGGVNKAWRWR